MQRRFRSGKSSADSGDEALNLRQPLAARNDAGIGLAIYVETEEAVAVTPGQFEGGYPVYC